MVMQTLRGGATGGVLKYFLLGLLVLAVGGFLLADVGSSFQGGLGSRDIARIEDKNISLNDFVSTVQRQMRNYNIPLAQAYQLGLIDQILTGEIRSRIAQIETEALGINFPDERIKDKIKEIIAPMLQEGQTPQETLELFLNMQSLNETQLVEGLDRELSIDILTQAMQTGYMGPRDQLARDLFLSQNQTRDIIMIVFPDEEIKDVPAPTKEQLEQLYNAYKNTVYAIPEKRDITIAFIDDSKEALPLTEDEIKVYYEDNIDDFIVPESYVLSQILIKDYEVAQKVYDLTQKGNSLKDAIIEAQGNDAGYYHEIPFDITLIPAEIREAIIDKPIGTIAGPIKTALGFHVTKLVRIDPAMTTPLEKAQSKIKRDLGSIKAEDFLYDLSIEFDDLLLSGADFEEISKEVPLIVRKINTLTLTSNAEEKGAFDEVADLFSEEQQEDKAEIITASFGLEVVAENSGLLELPSGRFASVILENITEKTSQPYEAVKDKIKESFIADQKAAMNRERIGKFLKEIESGETTFESIAAQHKDKAQTIKDIGVRSILPPPVTETMRPMIFRSERNDPYVVDLGEEKAKAMINVVAFNIPEITDEHKDQLSAIAVKVDQELKDEFFALYIQTLGNKYTSQINQSLMRAVFARPESQGQ